MKDGTSATRGRTRSRLLEILVAGTVLVFLGAGFAAAIFLKRLAPVPSGYVAHAFCKGAWAETRVRLNGPRAAPLPSPTASLTAPQRPW